MPPAPAVSIEEWPEDDCESCRECHDDRIRPQETFAYLPRKCFDRSLLETFRLADRRRRKRMVRNFVLADLDPKRALLRGRVGRRLRGELQNLTRNRLEGEVAVKGEHATYDHARNHEEYVERPFAHEQGLAEEIVRVAERDAFG